VHVSAAARSRVGNSFTTQQQTAADNGNGSASEDDDDLALIRQQGACGRGETVQIQINRGQRTALSAEHMRKKKKTSRSWHNWHPRTNKYKC
jgi:hypothetical protein